MENNLPQGWEATPLEYCCDILDNLRVPINSDERAKRAGNVPYYGATGQVGFIDDFIFNEELILIGEDGAPFFDKTKKIAYRIKGKSWVNNHAHVLRAKNEITSNSFLEYFLCDFNYTGFVNGTTRLKLNQGSLKTIPFLLPPLSEQQRIVSKLDAVMQKIESNKQRLEKLPIILKRFSQSLLNAAVNGILTEDWRKENKNVESAKTKAEKKKSRTVLDDKSKDYDLFDLPSKWFWKTISDVADVKGGKRVPKGEALVKYDTGFPYIKAGDLKFGTVQKHKLEYLLPTTQQKIKRYIISKGDVYITNVGACIGDAGIVPDDLDGANLTENALKMCNHEGVYNFYLSYWLQSPIAQDFIKQTILSAAQGKLALGRVEVFPIPLPPFEEQKEIVRRVERLFTLADKIEARYAKAKCMLDKLPQSILAKAFRGELVQQNPNDEPASVLLERIKGEKETFQKTYNKKKKIDSANS